MQSGWLRASVRKLDTQKSTLLEPVLSLRQLRRGADAQGRFAKLTVPLYYQGHAYRAGFADPRDDLGRRRRPAGLGVRRDAPGARAPEVDDRPLARRCRRGCAAGRHGVDVPTGLPPCPGLRGEPCRTYTGG